MRVLILAAGVGTRISRYLGDHPKSCVDIGGKVLLRNTVELFYAAGIKDIAIVTGYQDHYIHQVLKGLDYQTFRNPFYKVTNSIASMWFAKQFFAEDDDVLILNGDLFFERSMLDRLLEVDKSPLFLADSTRIEAADYRFQWQHDRLVKFGKELSNEETSGEYVGIAKICRQHVPLMVEQLNKLVDNGHYDMWWEDVFYSMVDEQKPVYIEDIQGAFWAEVDFIEDYNRILDYVAAKGNAALAADIAQP